MSQPLRLNERKVRDCDHPWAVGPLRALRVLSCVSIFAEYAYLLRGVGQRPPAENQKITYGFFKTRRAQAASFFIV